MKHKIFKIFSLVVGISLIIVAITVTKEPKALIGGIVLVTIGIIGLLRKKGKNKTPYEQMLDDIQNVQKLRR